MKNWLDLHMHSIYSNDGELKPSILMEKCAAAKLQAVALADHNTVCGVNEARETAHKLGMKYLTAIEVDCTHEGRNFHLLGYGINEQSDEFVKIEENVHNQEVAASSKYFELIHKLGFQFDDDKVKAMSKNDVIVAEMFAEVIFDDSRNNGNELLKPFRKGGRLSDNPLVNFFWEFMAQGKPAYVPINYPKFADIVKIIKSNGGAAVLAHPGANIGQNLEVTESIIEVGIDGIEVYSNYHDTATTDFYAKIAAENNLIATIGSDFHGKAKPAIHLGVLQHPNPDDILDKLNELILKRDGKVCD